MTSPSIRVEVQHDRRWLVLAVIALAQLMVVLDLTIVNVALPSAQHALGFSNNTRQWIVTAYALAFGSLLLPGGRLGDLLGRKWTFVGGLVGFAIASAVGGAANSFTMLVAARTVQGAFAAILAPSALGLLVTTFTNPSERGKAFGIYGAVAGGGSVLGLLLGGLLTQAVSWRLCMYVNVAIAIPAAIGGLLLVAHRRPELRPKIDLLGTVTAAGGLFALVYGFSSAELYGWGDALTVGMLIASAVLLIGFFVIESRLTEPLLPLQVIADRARGGAFLTLMFGSCALFSVFLFLTYFLQRTLDLSPALTGVAFLPLTVGVAFSSTASNIALVSRFGSRPVIATGMVIAAGALFWLGQLSPSSNYWADVLPPLLVLGLGYGATNGPAFAAATARVERRHAGVASATANTSQQVGGAVGAACLSTIFATALSSNIRTSHSQAIATVHGYDVAFLIGAAILAVGAVVIGSLFPNRVGMEAPAPSGPASETAAPAAAAEHS
jgi:EmrB/QacA subfamily drug resistance transporter